MSDKELLEAKRKEAEIEGWDDIPFLTDEELRFMFPEARGDAEFNKYAKPLEYSDEDFELAYRLEVELKDALENIAFNKKMLDSKTLKGPEKTETLADLRNEIKREERILKQMQELKMKYERTNRSL